jgi:integrase
MRRPIDELMVITAAYTGMRWGELSGLDRDNVDLDKGVIYVHPEVGALHEVGGKLFLGPPKTADSVREIDLPPFLTDRIRRSLATHCRRSRNSPGLRSCNSPGGGPRV